MICVFGSFVLSDLRVLKLIGFGLAFAVFIDATLVRLVLVPATMELLGDRNWWFPQVARVAPEGAHRGPARCRTDPGARHGTRPGPGGRRLSVVLSAWRVPQCVLAWAICVRRTWRTEGTP